ncbi:hypothetical protein CHUAL_012808 [Chamberlinius hualienensis]
MTPLHYAAELGGTDVIQILLDAGCRVNVADSENMTPLYLAASRGNLEAIIKLLKAGCQVDRKLASDKTTPLHIAASRGYPKVVEALIQYGAHIDTLDTSDKTPLLLAVNRANHEVVQILLNKGAKVNIEEIHGYTPLAEAIWKKDEFLVGMLLNVGAKVTRSHFLLHYCVMHRNCRLVQLLLASGCLVNVRDDNGDTPLHIATRTGEVAIMELLLQYGANTNYPNTVTGTTSLHEAVEGIRDCDHQKFVQIIVALLKYKALLNEESYIPGDVPLYRALLLEKYNVAAALIRYGCDVNKGYVFACKIDNLQLALKSNNFHIARLLVYAGFNMSRTAWLEVDEKSFPSTITTLKEWLIHAKCNPLSLRNQCRLVIRRQLKESIHDSILKLDLPRRLENFLFFEDAE